MMRSFLLFLLLVPSAAMPQPAPSAYDSVDPFIGTAAGGNTFPGATLPFGMIQWSPDTQADGRYHFGDKTMRGLSLTHISGAGCALYGDVPVLPWPGELKENPNDYVLPFSHDHELAHPGYYSVEFDDGIKAELTVAARAGIGRFYFPAGIPRTLIFKAWSATSDDKNHEADSSSIQLTGHDTITGSVQGGGFCSSPTHYTIYFAVKLEKPFESWGAWTDKLEPGAASAQGHKAGVYVWFPGGTESIVVKVGLSFVSTKNALANLDAEIPGWDFDAVQAAAKTAWEKMFDRVEADGGTPEQRTIFYTALYHMVLSPNVFSDENGDYIGFDNRIRRLRAARKQFANFSDWDIYRDILPFQAILFPEQTSQMMQSLVRDGEQSGWLPRWPAANDATYVMGGDSPAVLLSEAYSFGARSFDLKSALHFALKGATELGNGPNGLPERPGLQDYMTKGYVPLTDGQENAASVTLEYANADFAISRLAASLGYRAHAALLLRRAQNWRNLFDKDEGWIRPRTSDGEWLGDWDPDHLAPHHHNWDKYDQMGFEEGSTWQYTFMLPFNYAGLFGEMGGNDKVVQRLDKFFEKVKGWALPNFTVENEPDFCAPYAYLWTGNPWKTQQVIDRIRKETFTAKPDGIPGNDDLGATSGVYVWNAMGFYPEIPGVAGFTLGTPMFPRVTLHLGNGSTLEIVSKGEGIYVHSLRVNRRSHASSWMKLSELSRGQNKIEFHMQPDPDQTWATQPEHFPPSFDVPKSSSTESKATEDRVINRGKPRSGE